MPKIIWIKGKGKALETKETQRYSITLKPDHKSIRDTWKENSKSTTRATVAKVRGDQAYKDAEDNARPKRSGKVDPFYLGVLYDGKGLIPYQKAIARFKHEHKHCLRRNGTAACKVRGLNYAESKTWITQKAFCSVCNISVSFLYERKPKVKKTGNLVIAIRPADLD